MNAKAIKTVRKVERPRPLRLSSDGGSKAQSPVNVDPGLSKKPLTDFLKDFETVYVNLSNGNYDENTAAEIVKVCSVLKVRGQELDTTMKNLTDHYFVVFRNASREDRLDMVSRLQLLEVIELRAMGWQTNDNLTSFYRKKITELEGTEKPQVVPSIAQNYSSLLPSSSQSPVTAVSVPLAPGEILRSSGKFAKPTKIAGKNYFKDEVVIRNSDSGKVMGIKGRRVHMIEELSDTIISFQRVNPGARDRLVQITGPSEEAISHAKTLVEDTIRRNASPMREKAEAVPSEEMEETSRIMPYMNIEDQDFPRKQLSHSYSMGDASLGEYSYEISVGHDSIRLSSTSMDLVKISKYVLMKHFSEQSDAEKEELHIPPPIAQSDIMNFENMTICDNIPKNSLQRSSSWMGSIESTNSASTLDTSSDDDAFRNSLKQNFNEGEPAVISTNHCGDIAPPIQPPEPPRSISCIAYSRDELLKYRASPLCNRQPELSQDVLCSFPHFIASEKS